jgi:hypothetical protein
MRKYEKQWAEYNNKQNDYYDASKQLQKVSDDRLKAAGVGSDYNNGGE